MRMFPIVLSCLLLLVSCYRVPAMPTESDLKNVGNDNAGNENTGLDELTSYVDAAANVHDSKNEKDASDEKGCKEEKRRSLSKRNEDYSAFSREKRAVRLLIGSAVLQGIKAVKTLVKGAKKLPSDKGVKVYEKSGGFNRASRDFDRAKPKDVQPLMGPSGVLGKTGKVGDREVILRDGANGSRPTIEIKRTRDFTGQYVDQVTERISYRGNSNPRP